MKKSRLKFSFLAISRTARLVCQRVLLRRGILPHAVQIRTVAVRAVVASLHTVRVEHRHEHEDGVPPEQSGVGVLREQVRHQAVRDVTCRRLAGVHPRSHEDDPPRASPPAALPGRAAPVGQWLGYGDKVGPVTQWGEAELLPPEEGEAAAFELGEPRQ